MLLHLASTGEGDWGLYLVQRRHARHVDPVQVYLHARPPQHVHDGVPVALADVVLEHDLVREPHAPLAGVQPREHARPPRHRAADTGLTADTWHVAREGW